MKNLLSYQDIAAATDLTTFHSRLVAFANDTGFGLIAGVLVSERAGSFVGRPFGNVPAGHTEFTDASRGRRCSVIRRLKRSSIPFTYDQDMYVKDGCGDIWDHQAQFGFKTGVAMALHLAGDKTFAIGMDRDTPLPKDPASLTSLTETLALLAVHAQVAADQIWAEPTEKMPTLLRNEVECLKWRGAGKTAWETGQILSLSESHVAKLCISAARKLNCVNTRQAAVKALRLGLLH